MPTADSYERLARLRALSDLDTGSEPNRFRTLSDLQSRPDLWGSWQDRYGLEAPYPAGGGQPGTTMVNGQVLGTGQQMTGTSAYIGPNGAPGPGASVAELESYVRQKYGYMAGFLNIPEVRDVLMDAARNGWGPEELYGALSSTNWWKSTSAAARTWQQLVSEDPAEANRMAQENAATISDAAQRYGLRLSSAQIGSLAVETAKNGWSAEQQIDNILRNVNWETLQGGDLTASRDRVRALASQYLIRLSEQTARDYAERIARGELTEEGVMSMFQSQAKARFSYMAPLIDQGVTPNDYFAPARDVIASTLEVGSDTIDMMDPKWMGVLEVKDEGSGQLRAATMNEAMLSARRRPEWVNTRNAQELTASMVSGLANAFGRAG